MSVTLVNDARCFSSLILVFNHWVKNFSTIYSFLFVLLNVFSLKRATFLVAQLIGL